MAADAAAATIFVSAPSLVDLPDELFPLIAPYLNLWEVCQLRATCHRLLWCSAVLAGGCQPKTCNFERNGSCVPEAVLAWAVGRRHMEVRYITEPKDWVQADAKSGYESGVEWCIDVDTMSQQSKQHLVWPSPAIRRRLAMKIDATSCWPPSLEGVGDIFGFGSLLLTINLKYMPPCVASSVRGQLAANIARVGHYGMDNRGHKHCSYEPYELRAATAFAGVATVCLAQCSNLVDVTALAAAEHVDLRFCATLTDVSALRSVRRVIVTYCPQLTDVSDLGAVSVLTLRGCDSLTDVSALGRVQKLVMSFCNSLTDVSALRHIQDLQLSNCKLLTDVSTLGNVQDLDLSGCNALTDVSALGRVQKLDMSFCHSLTDVSALGHVQDLNLNHCLSLTDVSALGGNRLLNLNDCTGVSDVSALGGVRTLSLAGCIRVVDVSALGTVKTLVLMSCTGVVDVSALGNVMHLYLRGSGVTDYSALHGVSNLNK